MRALALGIVLSLLMATAADAHAGAAGPGWTLEPWVTAPLMLALAAFAAGWWRLRGRARNAGTLLRRRGILFAIGWSVLAMAVTSPLHAAGARSFAAHMLEHELLMLAAAPLLVLSEPLPVMLWAVPAPARRVIARGLRAAALPTLSRGATEPVTATLVQASALWLWHAPSLFERALASEGWHIAQHLSFLVSALLFWNGMLTRHPRRPGVAALCLFATSVVSGALGAMMAFSRSPWYRPYALMDLAPLGLTPAEDQQLAGLLMWIPGGAVHAAAALIAIAALLKLDPAEARHGA